MDKPERMKPLGRPRPRWENIIERDLRSNEIGRLRMGTSGRLM